MGDFFTFLSGLPTVLKIILFVLGAGFVFSIIKKTTKLAILLAVFVILVIVIMKLIA